MNQSGNTKPYQICTRCVMDTTDPAIVFDAKGICNHCHKYEIVTRDHEILRASNTNGLNNIVKEISNYGRQGKYDCIIGLSGGVDSTFVAYKVKELGLRPLAVHLDNGWNSEVSVNNIVKTLKALNIDLYTHVINWEEFRDLQIAFLKASIPGMEIPTDHAIFAILYQLAFKNNIKYIINGSNIATEAVMAPSWSEAVGQKDWLLIKNIHRRFGKVPLKTFPHFSRFDLFYTKLFRKINTINILNYMEYNKEQAMETIQNKLGWVYYGGKHYESIYTRFIQGYILPIKFGIDKRKAHFSSLICSGQLTRDAALKELEKDPYPSQTLKQTDLNFFLKKLNLTNEQFEEILKFPCKSYLDYPCYANKRMYNYVYKRGLKIHFYLKRHNFYKN